MEICHFCGNKNFKENTVQYTYARDGKYIMVEKVPCHQCEYCGEQYFAAKVLQAIEQEFEAVHVLGKPVGKTLLVPVETFADIHPEPHISPINP